MALNLKYSASLKNGRLDQITSKVGGSALLQIYDGAQPASPDTAVTSQNKLAEFVCNATFAPGASGGVLTANAIANVNAALSGTAAWFRLRTSGGTPHVDGTVGTSGCDMTIDNTSINSGQQVSISSLTFTAGN